MSVSLLQKNGVGVFAAFLAVVVVSISMYYALNIPRFDDFDQVLGFLVSFEESESWLDQMKMLVRERNEHRAGFFHLAGVLDYSIFGAVDFRRLIFLTNLFFLALAFVVYKMVTKAGVEKLHTIPILLFLLVPNFVLLNWCAAGMIYIPSILFSLLSLYALSYGGTRMLLLAVGLAGLSIINFTSGFLTFFAAIPFFFYTYKPRDLIMWFGGMAAIVGLFLIGYEPGVTNDPLGAIFKLPHVIAFNFLVFFGNPFKSIFVGHLPWHFAIGFVLLGLTAYVIWKHFRELIKIPLLTSSILFGLGLGAGIAIMRADNGIASSTAFRYELFQSILPIFLYAILVYYKHISRITLYWIIGLSLFFYALRMEEQVKEYRDNFRKMDYGMYVYQHIDDPIYLPVKKTRIAHQQLKEARSKEIYNYQDINVRPRPVYSLHKLQDQQEMRLVKRIEKETDDHYFLTGWAFLKYKYNLNLDIYVKLKSEDEVYYMPTGYMVGKKAYSQKADNGFIALIDKTHPDLSSGIYDMSIVLFHPINGLQAEQDLDKSIRIE